MNKYLDPKFLYAHLKSVTYTEYDKETNYRVKSALENELYFKNGKPDIYKYLEHAFIFEFGEISVIRAFLNKIYTNYWYIQTSYSIYNFKTNSFVLKVNYRGEDFFNNNLIDILSKINFITDEYSNNLRENRCTIVQTI